MIHKRIIDAADANPNAALAEISNEVPGASVKLVERVLDEYGDPADDPEPDTDTTDAPESTTSDADIEQNTPPDTEGATSQDTTDHPPETDQADTPPTGEATPPAEPASDETDNDANTDPEPAEPAVDLDALSAKRLETLRAINAYPEASQRDLAAKLGVTASTISQRVSGIEEFDWATRATFVDGLFDETRAEFDAEFGLDDATPTQQPDDTTNQPTRTSEPSTESPAARATASDGGLREPSEELQALEERVASLESALETQGSTRSGIEDPELLSKVVHACIEADTITTDEEHQVIEQLLD